MGGTADGASKNSAGKNGASKNGASKNGASKNSAGKSCGGAEDRKQRVGVGDRGRAVLCSRVHSPVRSYPRTLYCLAIAGIRKNCTLSPRNRGTATMFRRVSIPMSVGAVRWLIQGFMTAFWTR